MFDRQTVLTMSGKYFEIFIGIGCLVLITDYKQFFLILNIHITELESHTSVCLENENTK